MDNKEEFRTYCSNYIDLIKQIKLPEIKQNTDYETIFIEFRILPHIEFLIRNTIYKLGKNEFNTSWSHTIVCGNINYDYILNICKTISLNIKIIKLDYDNIDVETYNNILLDKSFWNLFNGTKLLIYQEDSCIFGNNINDFIKWDYIGAPWLRNDNQYGVGNGGFSLRNKNIMIQILDNIKPSNTKTYYDYKFIPEDVYFTTNMLNLSIGKLANKTDAIKFSSEQIIYLNSFGCHNFFSYYSKWKDIMYERVIKEYILLNNNDT
jgi:hypothetical protein